MGIVSRTLHSAKALGLAVVISVAWGGLVGFVLSFTDFARGVDTLALIGGFALLAPIYVLVFNTPFQRVVVALVQSHWVVAFILFFLFAIWRFLLEWPPVMIANALMSREPVADGPRMRVETEGPRRVVSEVTETLLGFEWQRGSEVLTLGVDGKVHRHGVPWGRVDGEGYLQPEGGTRSNLRVAGNTLQASGRVVARLWSS